MTTQCPNHDRGHPWPRLLRLPLRLSHHGALMAKIEHWAQAAAPGETYTYATTDTGFADKSPDFRAASRLEIAGLVYLVQRREPDRSISYLAIRTKR